MTRKRPDVGVLAVGKHQGESDGKPAKFECSLRVAQAHAKAHEEARASLSDVIDLMATWICREDPPESEAKQEEAA